MASKKDIAERVEEWVSESRISKYNYKTQHFKGRIITNEFELYALREKLNKLEECAFDTETTGLRVRYPGEVKLVGLSFSWGRDNNYYIPVLHSEEMKHCIPLKKVVKVLKPFFEREDIVLIGHNIIFDMHVLANEGIHIKTPYLYDTQIACWMINETLPKNLEDTVLHYYGYDKFHFKDIIATVPGELRKEYGYAATANVPANLTKISNLGLYAMDDTYWSFRLYLDTPDALEEEELDHHFYDRFMPYIYVVFGKERRGVKVDIPRLRKMQKRAEKDLEQLAYEIYELAGIEFNVNSDQQVQELLFGYEKYLPEYEEIKIPLFDSNGDPLLYKSGKNKGQQKFDIKKNKDKIVGKRFAGNSHIIDASFYFPITAKTKEGAPKTDAETLYKILDKEYKKDKHKQRGQDLVRLLIKFNKLDKLKGTYMDGLLNQIYADGKIHTSYNICGTDSGRLSSSEPNLQNLPRPLEDVEKPERSHFDSDMAYEKERFEYEVFEFLNNYQIRACFIPDSEDEVMQVHDYTNLEAMLQAEYSEDPLLIEMFAQGYDMHGYTAVVSLGLDCTPNECKKKYPKHRQTFKSVRFALQYGGTAFAISRSTGMSKEEAQGAVDKYYDTFKGEAEYKKRQIKFAHKYGYVYSLLGRKRHLYDINSDNFKLVGYNERVALNYPNQAGAADVIMNAQIEIDRNMELKTLGYRQIMQVHDELIGIVPKKNVERSMEIVKDIMEKAVKLKHVTLIADGNYSANNYAEAK